MTSSIPTTTGTYRIKLSALDGVAYTNFVEGRVEGVRAARAKVGAKNIDPIKLTVDRGGVVHIDDGNHRMRVARAEKDPTILAQVVVERGRGTWATKRTRRPR